MKAFVSTPGDAFRGVVAVGLTALGMGVVAPVSMGTALLMVVASVSLVASGPGRPVLRERGR